jgi:hypothetical protein
MAAFAPVTLDVSQSCHASSGDELCEQLLDHVLDCELCLDGFLDGREQKCGFYRRLRIQIETHGGATTPLIIAM